MGTWRSDPPLVEFRAPELDSAALEHAILERLRQEGAEPQRFGLADELEELSRYIDEVSIEISVRDQKLPLFNTAWNRIKHAFHELIHLYLSQLAGRQSRVNLQIVALLYRIATEQEEGLLERDRRIAALEDEVRRLRTEFGGRLMRRVFQLVPYLAPADAIGNFVLALTDWLVREGFEVVAVADQSSPDVKLPVVSPAAFGQMVRADDIVILHLCSCGETNRVVWAAPGPIIMYYHNITPAHFYLDFQPATVGCLQRARQDMRKLAEIRGRIRAIVSSEFSAHELARLGFEVVGSVPPFFSLETLQRHRGSPDAEAARRMYARDGVLTWLSVGRLVPNKRFDAVIRAFAHYHQRISPGSQLLLVGNNEGNLAALDRLKGLSQTLGVADAVTFTGKVTTEALSGLYALADVYVSLSEHEGFGVPLIEALGYDVPVVAYAAAAVPETLGDAGVLVHRQDPALVAHTVHAVLSDAHVRSALIAQQRRRWAELAPERLDQLHRQVLARAGLPLTDGAA